MLPAGRHGGGGGGGGGAPPRAPVGGTLPSREVWIQAPSSHFLKSFGIQTSNSQRGKKGSFSGSIRGRVNGRPGRLRIVAMTTLTAGARRGGGKGGGHWKLPGRKSESRKRKGGKARAGGSGSGPGSFSRSEGNAAWQQEPGTSPFLVALARLLSFFWP